MGTYIRDMEDERGELIDVFYFCSRGCWLDSFAPSRIGPNCRACQEGRCDEHPGCAGAREGGAAPCAASEAASDREVFCAECGVLMASPWRDTPVVVNLIERPALDPLTGAAEPVDPLSEEELERCQCGARAMDHEQPFLQCPEQ